MPRRGGGDPLLSDRTGRPRRSICGGDKTCAVWQRGRHRIQNERWERKRSNSARRMRGHQVRQKLADNGQSGSYVFTFFRRTPATLSRSRLRGSRHGSPRTPFLDHFRLADEPPRGLESANAFCELFWANLQFAELGSAAFPGCHHPILFIHGCSGIVLDLFSISPSLLLYSHRMCVILLWRYHTNNSCQNPNLICYRAL
jgi:hypothetical protein